ncbi:MAG TPA: hypothetical protein VKP65_21145 [Rhodothermales bacterium]|nr:hypothetical protein [Rhodothermales bacterium]
MDKAQTRSIHAEALRELRGRVPINTPAETPQEAREELAAYVIHPAFYEASASALAYEFLRDVLKREPTEDVTLWALYTEAAGAVLDRHDIVPVPAFGNNHQART